MLCVAPQLPLVGRPLLQGGFRAVVWTNSVHVLFVIFSLVMFCCLGIYKHLQQWTPDKWQLWNHTQHAQLK